MTRPGGLREPLSFLEGEGEQPAGCAVLLGAGIIIIIIKQLDRAVAVTCMGRSKKNVLGELPFLDKV